MECFSSDKKVHGTLHLEKLSSLSAHAFKRLYIRVLKWDDMIQVFYLFIKLNVRVKLDSVLEFSFKI